MTRFKAHRRTKARKGEGVTYYNDGDWVESCTALVEHFDGHMEIIDWAAQRATEAMNERSNRKAIETVVA